MATSNAKARLQNTGVARKYVLGNSGGEQMIAPNFTGGNGGFSSNTINPGVFGGGNGSTTGHTSTGDQTQDLINALMNGGTRNMGDLQNTARNLYQSYYDQLRLAAQQAHDNNALALEQQRTNLGRTYDRQRQESAAQYAQATANADQRALSRGMGRSSYNMQTLANLEQQGAQAQQDLWTRQGEDSAAIDAQLTQAQRQLQDQLRQYTSGQASDERAWIDQQMQADRERQNANYQYLLNYFNTVNQNNIANSQWERQFDANNRQWEREFNARYPNPGGNSGGSSGGSSSGGNNRNNTTTDTNPGGNSFADWINGLNNSGGNNTGASGTRAPVTSRPNMVKQSRVVRRMN